MERIADIQISDDVKGTLILEDGCLTIQRNEFPIQISDTLLNKEETAILYRILREEFRKHEKFPTARGAL